MDCVCIHKALHYSALTGQSIGGLNPNKRPCMLCLFSSLKICRKRKVLKHDRVTRITEVTPKEQQYFRLSVDHFTG